MRECVHCNCAAICIPLGREEFLSRLLVCNMCNFPVYAPKIGDEISFNSSGAASPFGPGRKSCNPICWAFYATFGLDRDVVGNHTGFAIHYATCARCRERLVVQKREFVTLESKPVNNNTADGAAYAWIVRR